jgi:hypothetical protein
VTKYTKDRSNKIHNYSYLLFQKIVSWMVFFNFIHNFIDVDLKYKPTNKSP